MRFDFLSPHSQGSRPRASSWCAWRECWGVEGRRGGGGCKRRKCIRNPVFPSDHHSLLLLPPLSDGECRPIERRGGRGGCQSGAGPQTCHSQRPVRPPPSPSKQVSFCIVVAFVFHNLNGIFISSPTGYTLNMPENQERVGKYLKQSTF